MTSQPLVTAPEALAPGSLTLMNTRRITSLFVVNEMRPTGILHMHDLLRAGVV